MNYRFLATLGLLAGGLLSSSLPAHAQKTRLFSTTHALSPSQSTPESGALPMKSFAKTSLLFALIIAGRYLQPTASAPLATLPSAEPTPAITRYVAPTKPVSASQRQTSRISHSYFL